MKLFFKFIFQ